MLKGIVNDVPKDIIRIPMKGKNLWDPDSRTTNQAGQPAWGVVLPAGTYTIKNSSNVSVYKRDGYDSTQASTFAAAGSTATYTFVVGCVVWGASRQTDIMLNIGSTALPYEPYGMQNGWEVRDQQGTILWGADKTLTGTDSISFKGYGLPLKSLTVQGNEQQTGTPTPSAPIQPQETGERTAQMIPYPYELPATETSGVTFSVDSDGRITATGRTTANLTAVIRYNIGMLTAGTYTFSVTGKHEGLILYVRDMVAQATIANILSGSTSTSTTVTLADNTSNEIRVYMTRGVGYDVDFDCTVQLEKGSKATEHKPNLYAILITLGTTQNIYLSEPIRKIGDYADVASATGTSGVATRRIKKLVLTGDQGENWLSNTLPQSGIGFHINIRDMHKNERTNGYCTHFEAVSTPSGLTTDGITYGVSYGEAVTQTFMYISFSTATATALSISDVTTFKAWLAAQYANGTPVCIWYVLATPETETFTAPILTPANGNNTLTVDTSLPPSEVSITGHVKQTT